MAAEAISSAWKVIPGLKTRDILATAKFYTDELRFTLGGLHSDIDDQTPTFLSVFVGAKAVVNIYYDRCEPENFTPGWVLIAMGTHQIDDYYQALVGAERVEIVEDIADKPWGYRQFSIKDVDGNKLTFFRFLEGGNPGK